MTNVPPSQRCAPFLSILCLACALALADENPKDSPAAAGPLATALQPFVDSHVISGAVVLVANKEKVLDLEAVGCSSMSSKAPMKTDALFWIASMTKSITATALMLLVQEGKIHIEDPVEKYLPEFKGQQVADEKDPGHLRPPVHPITIREIMSHTSGLVLANDARVKPTGSLKNDVALYAATPLIHEPGVKYEYNNCGINTGGRIIEVVSGMTYEEFVKSRLLNPLGMKDTTFWPDEGQARRLAASVRFTEDKKNLEDIDHAKNLTPALIKKLGEGVTVPQPVLANFGASPLREYALRYAMPAGGLFSTADDLAKLCRMLLNGGTFQGKRYLTEESIRTMSSDQTRKVHPSPSEDYGLGWMVKKAEDEGITAGSFGHRGARKTMMWIDPKSELTMILMIQNWELPGDKQKQLYTAFMKTAEEKYGKAR